MTELELRCLEILENSGQPERVINHCKRISEISAALALALNEKGFSLDVSLCRRAGLIHDIRRTEPAHSLTGSDYLLSLGLTEEAHITRHHMGEGINPEEISETNVVCLADKIAGPGERLITVRERFQPGIERFQDKPEALPSIYARMNTCIALESNISTHLGYEVQHLKLT